MGKIGKALLAIFLLVALAWAGDVWKEKPYQQWDQKDIGKVLNESPWAKITTVPAPWRAVKGSAEMGAEQPAEPPPSGSYGKGTAMGGQQEGQGEPGGAGGPESAAPSVPQTVFEARWLSAQTVREALVRSAILDGRADEAQAEKYLAQEVPDYQVWLSGPDMTPFANAEESTLNQDAYLQMKKSKLKLAPDRVQIQRDRDGKKVTAVLFSFPKKVADGAPTIRSDEKGIEFVCRFGRSTFKFSFDPQKMVDKQGRDL